MTSGKQASMKKKNIIVIKTDQQRFDMLGCMGHPLVKTLNIDALAEDGFIFNNAYCVSPLCVPSRTSYFTGQYVHRTGNVDNSEKHHIHTNKGCLLNILKENGYTLALAGKNHAFGNDYIESFFDYREEYSHWGKTHGSITAQDEAVSSWLKEEKRFPESINGNLGKMEGLIEDVMPFPEEECPSSRIAQDALAFLDKTKENKEQPFCLHLSFPDPHWPNVVCEPYYSMYNPDEIILEAADHDWENKPFAHWVQSRAYGFNNYSGGEVKRIVATYLGQISFIDKSIGMLLDKLKESGMYEDTVIVFSSDHGDYAGRYNLVAKTKAFYDSLIRIPLIVKLPGIHKPGTINANISNIDILPTIFDYLGLEIPEETQGKSFLPVLTGNRENHREEIFAEVGMPVDPPSLMNKDEFPAFQREQERTRGIFWFCDYTLCGRSFMIKKNGWKYCYYVGDREELYNVNEDEFELHNLAGKPEYAEKQAELKNGLIDWYLTETLKSRQ